MAERTCIECGRTIVKNTKGRPPTRCGECNRGRERKKQRDPIVCLDCAVVFEAPGHTGLLPKRCPDCAATRKRETDAAKAKRWRESHPDRVRESNQRHHAKRKDDPEFRERRRNEAVKRMYGITREQLDEMLKAQGHRCAICNGEHVGVGSRLHIDHCHESNRIRGLLCGKCNTAVGLLDDDPERAEALAAYLRQ